MAGTVDETHPRFTVSDIVEAVRVELHNGVLVAGQAVRERELATRFGVSRTPAREAINRLISEGILTSSANRGATVARPTPAELEELYEIRLQLEPMAARLAAENADGNTLKAIAAAVDHLDHQEGPEFLRHHLELHLSIARATGRPLLHQLIENLRSRSDPYVRIYLGVNRKAAQEGHRQILAALLARDGEAAAAATRAHLLETLNAVRPFLQTDSATTVGRPG